MAGVQDSSAARAIAITWLIDFTSALYSGDPTAVANSLLPTGWFRDVLTFTWDMRSLEGTQKIISYLSNTLSPAEISDVKLDESLYLAPVFFIATPTDKGVEVAFKFEAKVGHGRGLARLLKDGLGEWKALSVSMMLCDLRGHEEAGYESGIYGGHTLAWGDVYAERKLRIESDPHVLIVGGGQSGVQVAARFKQMNISSLLIERNARIGDNWRKRYPTLTLHTAKNQHELLYQPYPSNWPFFTPRDKIADWLESYVMNQDLVAWTNSTITGHPTYDSEKRKWNVTIDHNGTQVEIHPTHIVLATGTLGDPNMPTLIDQDKFQGTIIHSTQYYGGTPYTGKRVVIIGAGNTSIDICQDLCHHQAASVTMVQRSSSCVVSGDKVGERLLRNWADGAPAEIGDFKFGMTPLGLTKKTHQGQQEAMWEEERELHNKLRKGGIKLNLGPEGQGQHLLVFERAGGYWLDKGGADLIASGDIKVKQGVQPTRFTELTLAFADDSELEADVVIFATGYTNIRECNKRLFGEEVINQTSEVYGLDSEGELRGSYRPTGHPGLWYATGDFFNSRFMSKQLAIQIKAIELGLMVV